MISDVKIPFSLSGSYRRYGFEVDFVAQLFKSPLHTPDHLVSALFVHGHLCRLPVTSAAL